MSTASDAGLLRPRALLFDWDNTLVDSWPVIHEALTRTFRAFGREPWTFEETRVRVRKSMRDSFPVLFGARWEEAAAKFHDIFRSIHLDKISPFPGVESALAELRESGVYLGVVSNKNGDILRAEAAHLGWQHYFGRLVGALDAALDKPAPEPVDLALSGSGIRRGPEVWLAGDADIDLECARNAGCVPVLLREEAPQPGEFEGFGPTLYLAGCQALSNLVRRL